jgi:hypothetical protein
MKKKLATLGIFNQINQNLLIGQEVDFSIHFLRPDERW